MLKGYDGEAYKDHSWVAFLTHSLIDGSELNAFHIKNILSPDLCSVPRVLQPELKNALYGTWRTIIYCTYSCVLEQKRPVAEIARSSLKTNFYLFIFLSASPSLCYVQKFNLHML